LQIANCKLPIEQQKQKRQNRRKRLTWTKRMYAISSRKRQRAGHSNQRTPTTQDGPRLAKKQQGNNQKFER